jgi:hypothetical protein
MRLAVTYFFKTTFITPPASKEIQADNLLMLYNVAILQDITSIISFVSISSKCSILFLRKCDIKYITA